MDTSNTLKLFSNIVAGIGSAANLISSRQAQQQMEELYGAGTQQMQVGMEAQRAMMGAAQTYTDPVLYAQMLGIRQALLSGRQPQELAPFRNQFEEIDLAAQQAMRDIDTQAKNTQFIIHDRIADGGAKVRMLADLAIKTMDAKQKVISDARTKARDLNIELKAKYTTDALRFAEEQPKIYGALAASGRTGGYAPSGGAMLQSAGQQGTDAAKELGKIGESVANIWNTPPFETAQPTTKWMPSDYPDYAERNRYLWDKPSREKFLDVTEPDIEKTGLR